MEKLQEYALLKMRIKDVEDQLKALEKEIIPMVEKAEDMKLTQEYGTFSITDHVMYEYGEKVQTLEKKVKELKEIEKIKGTAVKKTKPKFVFMPAKYAVPPGAYTNEVKSFHS